MIGNNISIMKIFGIFGTFLIMFLIFGPMVVKVGDGIKTGDWSGILQETGGKFASLDNNLKEESNWLVAESAIPEGRDNAKIVFHLAYSVTILFIMFAIFFLIFRFGNWLSGKAQWSPGTDILISVLIIIFFITLQFLYTVIFLDEIVWPFQGVWGFLKNFPMIVKNLFV